MVDPTQTKEVSANPNPHTTNHLQRENTAQKENREHTMHSMHIPARTGQQIRNFEEHQRWKNPHGIQSDQELKLVPQDKAPDQVKEILHEEHSTQCLYIVPQVEKPRIDPKLKTGRSNPNTKIKTKIKDGNENIICKIAMRTLDKRKEASQRAKQGASMAHRTEEIRAPGHPENERTKTSQAPTNAQTNQSQKTAHHACPMMDPLQIWLMQAGSDTSSPYIMDAEMQAEQEQLTIALNREEEAYDTYIEKINRWNAQRNASPSEDKTRGKIVLGHNQIRNRKQKDDQQKGEKQHRTPTKPNIKKKRAPKVKSPQQNRDMENELGNLKKANYRAKQTEEQGREVNTKKLSQKIKQKRAQPLRYNYPASRENIESLKSSPLILGPGVFSNSRKRT
jgi:hypothetical protein